VSRGLGQGWTNLTTENLQPFPFHYVFLISKLFTAGLLAQRFGQNKKTLDGRIFVFQEKRSSQIQLEDVT
jgi:hypothetical protein